MSHPIDTTAVPEENDRRGQLLLRTLPILLIPVVVGFLTFVLLQLITGAPPQPARPPDGMPVLGIVVVVIFFSALITLVRVGRSNLSAYLLIGVWALATTVAALQNGLTTNWPALLIVPICAAGLLIDGVASISLAGLASVLVLSVGYLEVQGITFRLAALAPASRSSEPMLAASFWAGVYWTIALLTSQLARGLQRALQQSRAQAAALQLLNAELEQRVATQTARLIAQERDAAILEERARVPRAVQPRARQIPVRNVLAK